MPLSTIVKVGNISNLSDARYCAGMGVEMVGVTAIEGRSDYLSPALFQEIRGWISGPRIVAQVYGLKSKQQLAEVIESYAPDCLELTFDEFLEFQKSISLPCLVLASKNSLAQAKEMQTEKIDFFIVQEDELALVRGSRFAKPLLFQPSNGDDILKKIEHHQIKGIALIGSQETRPGFKDYSHLSEILELLEED